MNTTQRDVVIIGAGPAGSVAAAMLVKRGYSVEVLERQHFPRFSIGESLLPQCMEFLAEADLLESVQDGGFQFKDGAAFHQDGVGSDIYFPDKSAPGPGTTFQVKRADFDHLLAQGAAAKGAEMCFGEEVIAFASNAQGASITVRNDAGLVRQIDARFALDASGFGRSLAKLLDLETPSSFPPRRSLFGQVVDHISEPSFDRNKILISIHPHNRQIWFWLIPLADGLSSIGAVGPREALEGLDGTDHERLWALIGDVPYLAQVLKHAQPYRPISSIVGYACAVKSLIGPRYALLGNAAEFLDPVFSSGVTIAMKSASLSTKLIDKELRGEAVDWQRDFVDELYVGIETFRACVGAWYSGKLQRIIFNRPQSVNDVSRMLTSVLAGYAWDRTNSIVRDPVRFLDLVDQLCATNTPASLRP